jgi:hypothetical protein
MSTNYKKIKAIALRQKGLSYGQILKEMNLSSKGTLSYWFKNLVLTNESRSKLKLNYELSKKRGLIEFNNKRKLDIKEENKKFLNHGKLLIKINTKEDLLITGACLYWGEGTKYEGKCPSLIFTNSDPKMISLYMHFIRKGLCVDENIIKGGIHLHPHIKEDEAREFWSKVTNLPKDLFYIVNVKNVSSKGKRYKRKLPYGMVVIKVNKRKFFYLVKGMIESLTK